VLIATNREIIAETNNIKVFIGCLVEGIGMQVQEKTLSLLHNLTVASKSSLYLFLYLFSLSSTY
jgi:hypothetical protein